jgi:hypothetical protein
MDCRPARQFVKESEEIFPKLDHPHSRISRSSLFLPAFLLSDIPNLIDDRCVPWMKLEIEFRQFLETISLELFLPIHRIEVLLERMLTIGSLKNGYWIRAGGLDLCSATPNEFTDKLRNPILIRL